MGDYLVGGLLLLAIGLSLWKLKRNRKETGGGCGTCSSCSRCSGCGNWKKGDISQGKNIYKVPSEKGDNK